MGIRSRWISILAVLLVLGLAGCSDGSGGGSGSSSDDDTSGAGDGGSDDGNDTSSLDVEWLHPRPVGGTYAGMAQGGGTYVVAGNEGRYLRSTDGQDWTAGTLTEPDDLAEIAFLDGQFVAVGEDDTGASVVYTASDGQDWTRTESYSTSFTGDPAGIARDGSQYLVAGYDGVSTNTDLTDPDGWTLAVDADKRLRDIACNDSTGECVAVGNLGSSHTIHYLDGNGAWSEVGPTPADAYKVGDLRAVTWTGSAWVAVGDNSTILSSADGQTWTEQENYDSTTTWGFNEAVTFRDVAVVGSSLYAVGHYTDGAPVEPAVVLKGGTNGSGWSVVADKADWGQAHGVYADASGHGWVVGEGGDLHRTDDGGSSWTDATTLLTPNYLVHLALDDSGRLIASGQTDTLRRNADGTLEWFAGAGLYQAELAWDGQRFVAFPDGGLSTFGVSTDGGETWAESDTGSCIFSGGPEALYNGDDFVVSSTAGVCLGNPTDGWALHETGYSEHSGSEYLNGLAFDGTTYVVVGNSGHLATSPDGANWTVQTTPVDSELYDVAWTGSQFVAVGSDELVMTSPAGSSWTEVTGLPAISYQHIAADPSGGILLAVGGTVCHTGDTTLTACEETSLRVDQAINDIAWHDGAFYASGDDGMLVKLTP